MSNEAYIGLTNDNDFFSAHYLSEVFAGDLKSAIEGWDQRAEATPPTFRPWNSARSNGTSSSLRRSGCRCHSVSGDEQVAVPTKDGQAAATCRAGTGTSLD